jgi:serine/threonine-protein kinase
MNPGDRVDRYLLVEQLGAGGQGEVWRALDPLLEPSVSRAVKLVHLGRVRPEQAERVRREARQLAKLRHPSLVACHGMFEDVGLHVLGIVMDFVDGRSLAQAIDDPLVNLRHHTAVLAHLASALAYVHRHQIVHRDVKAENVIVSREFVQAPEEPGCVKLVDFGIAAGVRNPSPLTGAGQVIGTPSCMPPEQLDPARWQQNASKPAADVFAFGVLAWRLLIGGHPTGLSEGSLLDYATAYRRVESMAWPPDASRRHPWGKLLSRCLALDPSHRASDGTELVAIIRELAPESPITTIEDSLPVVERSPATHGGVATAASAPHSTEPAIVNVRTTSQAMSRTVPGSPPLVALSPARPAAKPRSTAARSHLRWWLVGGLAIASLVIGVSLSVVAFWWWNQGDEEEGNTPTSPTPPQRPPLAPTIPTRGVTPPATSPPAQGETLDNDRRMFFRLSGAVIIARPPTGRAPPPESFPSAANEKLCVSTSAGDECCIEVKTPQCRVPLIVVDLTRSGDGVSVRLLRDEVEIVRARGAKVEDATLRWTRTGYWIPIPREKQTFVGAGGNPFGEGKALAKLSGFLDAE